MSDVSGVISNDYLRARQKSYAEALQQQGALNGPGLPHLYGEQSDETILLHLKATLKQQDDAHKKATAPLRRVVELLSERIILPTEETCQYCGGSGHDPSAKGIGDCPACDGAGKTPLGESA